ncbi:MAG: hypothetical protein AAB254_03065, partial [candidate division NC10 bacterium]
LFEDLRKLTAELGALTDRALTPPGRGVQLGPMGLATLNILSHQMARQSEDLNRIHRAKVTRLMQTSQGMMGAS